MWDEIIYPFLNLTGCSVEVWEWINSFIPRFNGASDYLSMLVLKLGHVNKMNTWYLTIPRGTSSITSIVAKKSQHRMLQISLIFYNHLYNTTIRKCWSIWLCLSYTRITQKHNVSCVYKPVLNSGNIHTYFHSTIDLPIVDVKDKIQFIFRSLFMSFMT